MHCHLELAQPGFRNKLCFRVFLSCVSSLYVFNTVANVITVCPLLESMNVLKIVVIPTTFLLCVQYNTVQWHGFLKLAH